MDGRAGGHVGWWTVSCAARRGYRTATSRWGAVAVLRRMRSGKLAGQIICVFILFLVISVIFILEEMSLFV